MDGETEVIERPDDLVEYRVTASWDLVSILDDVANEEEIGRLRAAAAAVPAPESLPIRFLIGLRIKAALDRKRQRLRLELASSLGEHSAGYGLRGMTEYHTVMDATFLVRRSRETLFLERLRELDAHSGGALSFQCSEPLLLRSLDDRQLATSDLSEDTERCSCAGSNELKTSMLR